MEGVDEQPAAGSSVCGYVKIKRLRDGPLCGRECGCWNLRGACCYCWRSDGVHMCVIVQAGTSRTSVAAGGWARRTVVVVVVVAVVVMKMVANEVAE